MGRGWLEESSSHPKAPHWSLPSQSDCLSFTLSLPPPHSRAHLSLPLFPPLSLPYSPLSSLPLSPLLSSSRCRAPHWLPLRLIPSQSALPLFFPALFCMHVSILFPSPLVRWHLPVLLWLTSWCVRACTYFLSREIWDWFHRTDLCSMLSDMWMPRATECNVRHRRPSCSFIIVFVLKTGLRM